MRIPEAIKLIFQKLKNYSVRISRIEQAISSFMTNGAIPPEVEPYEEINFDEIYFIDNEGHLSRLKYDDEEIRTSVVWDDEHKCWRFYAVYAD